MGAALPYPTAWAIREAEVMHTLLISTYHVIFVNRITGLYL
jgi:hypothetical protein